MVTIPTTTLEESDKVRQQNLTDAISGVSTNQLGTPSDHYIAPAGPVQSVVPAPTPAPAPIAGNDSPVQTPTPTIGEQLSGIKSEALRIQDMLPNTTQGNFNTAPFEEGQSYDPFDEDKARKLAQRNQLALHQSEIDATNKVYDTLLSEARLEGEGRLGSGRARAARGGLLGSDFAGAQKDRVQNYNTAEQQGVEAQRMASIGNIMAGVRAAVSDEVEARRTAKEAGAEEYTQFLSNKKERKDNYVNQIVSDMLVQGFDINTLSKEELEEIGRPAGITTQELLAAYATGKSGAEAAGAESDLETRKTEADIAKIEAGIESGKYKVLGDGSQLVNMETGERIENVKNYAPDRGTSGGSRDYSAADEQILLAGGYSVADQQNLKSGIDEMGLPAVIAAEKKAGATDAQIAAIEKAYGVEAEEPSGLSRENIASFYGLTDNDEMVILEGEGWFGRDKKGDVTNSAQLDEIMKLVANRQALGMTDAQILKEIKDAQ